MNPVPTAEFWVQFCLRLSAETAAVILLAALAGWAIRSTAWRRTLWQVTPIALALVLAAELTGTGQFTVFRKPALVKSERRFVLRTNMPIGGRLREPEKAVFMPIPSSESSPAIQQASANSPSTYWWPAWIWAVGFGFFLARFIMARVLLILGGERLRFGINDPLSVQTKDLGIRFGFKRLVRLLQFRRLRSPIAFGVLRPAIGLPPGFCARFSNPQQQAMLAHEMAHLAARDPFWHGAAEIVSAALWWNPVVWWARLQLHAASEAAADEASIVVEDGPANLAQCLVDLGRQLNQRHQLSWLGVEGGGFHSGVGRRVERLLRLEGKDWRPTKRISRLALLLTGCAVALLTLALSSWAAPQPQGQRSLLAMMQQAIGSANTEGTTTQAREVIVHKLRSIKIDQSPREWESGVELSKVVKQLSEEARSRDPDKEGISFVIKHRDSSTNSPTAEDISSVKIHLRPLNDISFYTLLDAILKTAEKKITYSIEDYGILFKAKAPETIPLYTRTFKVDPNTFIEALTNLNGVSYGSGSGAPWIGGVGGRLGPFSGGRTVDMGSGKIAFTTTTNISANINLALRAYFQAVGVDFGVYTEPGNGKGNGKAIFFSQTDGRLLVRATLDDLDIIEKAIEVLNLRPPQIGLTIRSIEINDDRRPFDLNWVLRNLEFAGAKPKALMPPSSIAPSVQDTNSAAAPEIKLVFISVLTDSQFRLVAQVIEQRSGDLLRVASQITTQNGRQVAIITTGVSSKQPLPLGSGSSPSVDVVPYVHSDGYTIQLNFDVNVREFLGYDPYPQTSNIPRFGGEAAVQTPVVLPTFRVHHESAKVEVWDGQTVVLGLKMASKESVIFMTSTMIDPAGNVVHSAEQLRFSSNSIPAQIEK